MISLRALLLLTATLVFVLLGRPLHAQLVFQPPADSLKPRIRSTRLAGELDIDGILQEDEWERAGRIKGFVQNDPYQGRSATFDSEVRVAHDDDAIYIGARLFDTTGYKGVRVFDLRRDFDYMLNDVFGIALDPFMDKRNAVSFQTNPYGAQRDLLVLDDRFYDTNWDALWRVSTAVTDSGWTAEMAIPWKTLRYNDSLRTWGLNVVRKVRRINEVSGWSLWPRAYTYQRMAYAGILEGLTPPPAGINLNVQPYVLGNGDLRGQWQRNAQIGGDAKWAATQNTVVDLTINTDFAQADVDRQVINLSRFNVFFPERRQFFLENANLFSVGSGSTFQPFFSRRIGLDNNGNPIPIIGGLRAIRRSPERNSGALAVMTDSRQDQPSTAFVVLRHQELVGQQSRVGALAVYRADNSQDAQPANTNLTASIDGLFRIDQQLTVESTVSMTHDTRTGDAGLATLFKTSYDENWVFVNSTLGYLDRRFNPRTGFVAQPNIMFGSFSLNFDFRPQLIPDHLRSYNPSIFARYIWNAETGLFDQGSVWVAPIQFSLHSGARLEVSVEYNTQNIVGSGFQFFRGLTVRPGFYGYAVGNIALSSDQSDRFTYSTYISYGEFYDGHFLSGSFNVRAAPLPHVTASMRWVVNQFTNVGQNAFLQNHLLVPELRLALNPRLQWIGIYQYNTSAQIHSANLRLSWEFQPLSFLYVVYNINEPFIENPQTTSFVRQQGIAKLTYLRQF